MRLPLPAALAVAATIALGSAAHGAAEGTRAAAATSPAATATGTKIRIRIGTRTLTATVARNPTARDFVSLLPLTLRMHDLFGREKAAPLPRPLARGGRPRYTYSPGDIIYWPPGPHAAREDDGVALLALRASPLPAALRRPAAATLSLRVPRTA